jgi:hypothetical protein
MKPKRIAAILLVLLGSSIAATATAQIPDRIVYEGKEYDLQTNPMEDYFNRNPSKRPKGSVVSSALWRGYIATFEISDNVLYLKDISIEVSKKTTDGSFDTEPKSVLRDVVPEGGRLKIDWFTGLLVLPYGKLVSYVHMGYGSTFEKYVLIEVDRGDFRKAKRFDNPEYEKFKARQFEAFRKTPEYRELVEKMKKDGSNQAFIDSFLRSFVTSYTTRILED